MEIRSPLINLQSSSSETQLYTANTPAGEGSIKRVSVMPGIDVVFTDMRINSEHSGADLSGYNGFEIFYCIKGLFEIELINGQKLRISDNHMMVYDISLTIKKIRYLEERIAGISIFFIENEKANESLERYLGENYIDINTFMERVCGSDVCPIIVPNRFSMDIFVNIEQCPAGRQIEYLRLKALELYLICSKEVGLIDERKMKQTNRIDLDKLKEVFSIMKKNTEEPLTLKQLAICVDMNPDRLKKLFKSRYKENISSYYRRIRLQQARLLLLNTDFSITEVASMAGYNNPSKFTSAFKNEYGYTPISYRKSLVSE